MPLNSWIVQYFLYFLLLSTKIWGTLHPVGCSLQKSQASSHRENNIKEITQSPLFYTVSFNNFFLINQVTVRLCPLSIHSLGREGRDHCSYQVSLQLLMVGRRGLLPRDVPGSCSSGDATGPAQKRTKRQHRTSRLLNPPHELPDLNSEACCLNAVWLLQHFKT